MKKRYLVLIMIILVNNMLYSLTDTSTTTQNTNTEKPKQKKVTFSVSSFGLFHALIYCLTNTKTIAGSIVIIGGILKYMWNSSLSANQKLQIQVDDLQGQLDELKKMFKADLQSIKTNLTDSGEIIKNVRETQEEIKENTKSIKNDTSNLFSITKTTNGNVESLEVITKETNNKLENVSKKMDDQGVLLEAANTLLEGSFRQIEALKEKDKIDDETHNKTLINFTRTLEKNTEITAEYNEKVKILNEENEKIKNDVQAIKSTSSTILSLLQNKAQN